jgi:hypothetical protein
MAKHRKPSKAKLRAAAMVMAEAAAGRENTLRAALKDARGQKARKKRKKKRSGKGGQIPMEVLLKRYDRLGRILKSRGFNE